LADEIMHAGLEGKSGKEIDEIEARWMKGVKLVTFDEGASLSLLLRLLSLSLRRTNPSSITAVENHLIRTSSSLDAAASAFSTYKQRVEGANLSNREAREVAKEVVGEEVKWDWDLPRTKEGYYHYKGGMAVRSPSPSRFLFSCQQHGRS
jgi:isocitrate lyase